jgi:hypothetical protein
MFSNKVKASSLSKKLRWYLVSNKINNASEGDSGKENG